jgi:hypothetical protein
VTHTAEKIAHVKEHSQFSSRVSFSFFFSFFLSFFLSFNTFPKNNEHLQKKDLLDNRKKTSKNYIKLDKLLFNFFLIEHKDIRKQKHRRYWQNFEC